MLKSRTSPSFEWHNISFNLSGIRYYESLQVLVPVLWGIIFSKTILSTDSIIIICSLLGHTFFSYSYNDYCDFEVDKLNNRKLKVGKFSKKYYRNLSIFFFGVSFIPLLFCQNISIISLVIFLQVLAFIYSYYKEQIRQMTLLPQAIHLLCGISYFFIGANLGKVQNDQNTLILSLYFGLLYAFGSLNSELIDYKADKSVNALGILKKFSMSQIYYAIIALQFLSIFLVSYYLYQTNNYSLVAFICFGFLVYLKNLDKKNLLAFRRTYRLLFNFCTLILLLGIL